MRAELAALRADRQTLEDKQGQLVQAQRDLEAESQRMVFEMKDREKQELDLDAKLRKQNMALEECDQQHVALREAELK